MIFRPPLLRAILAGRKTTTRRPRNGERDCRYQPGRNYAIQPGRGKPSVARIHIETVEPKQLLDFTYQDARAEGFNTQRDFYDYWLSQHDHIDIHLDVWVITFRLEQDQPRFLTPAARPHGTTHGYTANHRNALEPVEAVPEHFQREITEQARARDAIRLADEHRRQQGRSLTIRLKDAIRRSDPDAIASVKREIDTLEQQIRHAA